MFDSDAIMAMHIEMDLNDVTGFDPTSTLTGSPWPNHWLTKIKQKFVHRMSMENENQLQFTLNHLLAEAREVRFPKKPLQHCF